MTSEDLSFVEIVRLDDPNLLQWLDLYETAFPAQERILVSSILQIISTKKSGKKATSTYLLAVLNTKSELAGLTMYSLSTKYSIAFLWYLAVNHKLRSRGIGSQIYKEIIRRIHLQNQKALIFEVEIPARENSENAHRRIRFYHQQGAFLLDGIHYMQHVGWHQEPIPMHVMVHPIEMLDPESAFDLAKSLFDDSIEKTGDLRLV
jgi:GNAT superfamily N-acetyltransferase